MKASIITDQISQDLALASDIVRKYGLEYVELHGINGKSVETLSLKEAREARKILDEHGLKVSNLASTIFFMAPLYEDYEISLFKLEFAVFTGIPEEHLKQLDHACQVADILDCQTLRVFPFRFPDNKPGKKGGTPEDLDRIADYMSQAAAIAEKHGKTLVLENCPYSHLPKGMMTREIVRRVDSPALKLLWDPGNSYRAEKTQVPEEWLGPTLCEEFDAISDQIGHVHVKNYQYDATQEKPFVHRRMVEGDIDYDALMKRLGTLDVALSLELELEPAACICDMDVLKSFHS